jgi:hypothetical protein
MTYSVAAADGEVLRHLLLSFPELDVAHDGHDVVDALVEGAVGHLLGRHGVSKLLTLHDVATVIQDLAGLSYEPAELVASFERLAQRARLSFRDPSHRSFIYDEAAYRTTAESFRLRMSAWDSVRSAWIDEVRQRYAMEEGQAKALWDGLDAFTAQLVNAHTAEAAAFLYIRDAAGQSRFYEALSLKLPDIDDLLEPSLREIAKVEFARFFDPSDPARTDYLTGRLRASFFFHLLSVDPSASELVREHVSDKELYLDSNFLFRLLGYHGPAAAFAPITVVEISRQLNCRMVVAQETVDEYIRVVRANAARLKATPIKREAYLRIAGEHPSDDGEFMAAYYRDLVSGRVKSVDDFTRRWVNIHVQLKEWGIEVDGSAVLAGEEAGSEDFLDQLSQLTSWHRGEKHPDAVMHDVFILRFMKWKRGGGERTPGRTKHWFLTYDRQLTRYAAYHATEEDMPSTLLADDWLQIARPFLPRTENYAKSFVAMLRHPMLFHTAKVPFAHMAQALSRLERYVELPAPLVAAIVADEQFVRGFTSAEGEDGARHLLELRIGELAGDVIDKNEGLREDIERALNQIGTLQEQVDTLRDARDTAERDRDHWKTTASESGELAAHRVVQAERDAARQTEARVDALRSEYDTKVEKAVDAAAKGAAAATEAKLRPSFEAQVQQSQRWTAYWVLCIAASSAAAVFLSMHWETLGAGQVIVTLGWVAMMWVLLLAIPKGWNVMWTALGGIVGLAGLILGARELWKPPAERTGSAPGVSTSSTPRPPNDSAAALGRAIGAPSASAPR